MEGTNNAGNRGAYAPVTVAIAPGDENIVPPKTQTKKKGVCASLSRMQLLILIVVIIVIVIVIIIIIAVVVSSKKEKLAAATAGPNVTQPVSSSSIASISMKMTTTPAPPTTTPTPGPPGSFNGYMVLDLPYKDSYDDVRDSERSQLIASFTTAINDLYSNSTVYQGVTVSALLKTTSAKVQVEFEISVGDISKGARLILVEALSPLPSALNTYTILEMDINPEEATGTDQATDG